MNKDDSQLSKISCVVVTFIKRVRAAPEVLGTHAISRGSIASASLLKWIRYLLTPEKLGVFNSPNFPPLRKNKRIFLKQMVRI